MLKLGLFPRFEVKKVGAAFIVLASQSAVGGKYTSPIVSYAFQLSPFRIFYNPL